METIDKSTDGEASTPFKKAKVNKTSAKRLVKLFDKVETRFQKSRDGYNNLHRKFTEFEKLYLGYVENKDNAWKSSISDPEAFEKVERMTSHLVSTPPRGNYVPANDAEDYKAAHIADEVFRSQWNKPGQNMYPKIERMVKGAALFGISFGVLGWRYEKNKKGVVVWDDPYFKDLYIYDCFPDPSAMNVDDMNWFIHNEYTTLADLEAVNNSKDEDEYGEYEDAKKYINLDKLKAFLAEDKNDSGSETTTTPEDNYRNTSSNIRLGKNDGIYGRFLIRKMYTKDRCVTIVPDANLVIEDNENYYEHGQLPIHTIIDHSYPNQLFGIGEVEPIAKLQKGLNALLNLRLDNIRLIMNPPMKVKANSRYAGTWKWKIGQKWLVDMGDEIMPFQLPDVTGNTFAQQSGYFKETMSKALGHFDTLSRANVEKSAAEVRAVYGEQNARLKAKENQIDHFIVRLAQQWLQLNQQYLSEDRAVRIVGKDALDAFIKNGTFAVDEYDDNLEEYVERPETVTYQGKEVNRLTIEPKGTYGFLVVQPGDIQGQFDFVAESGSMSMIDPTQEANALMMGINLLAGHTDRLAQEGVKPQLLPLFQTLFRRLNIKNVDDIFAVADTPDPMAMEQGQEAGVSPEQQANAMREQLNPDAGNQLAGGGMNVVPPQAPEMPIAGQMPNLSEMPAPPGI
jgi:hypothetical protein